MNSCVAKYPPKTKIYSKSISLEARVKTAAGIYNDGYQFSCTDIIKVLEVNVSISIELYLLEHDKIKRRKSSREHDHTNMIKR